ncbi:hypothetical protein U3516DRAFT_767915 [Neocallimastix sp. 'constans']
MDENLKIEFSETNKGKEQCDASISITKHRTKEEIRKSSIPFDIRPKRIYNEISKEYLFITRTFVKELNSISNTVKKVFPEVENNIDLYIHYKLISNFPFINLEYMNDIYNKIKNEIDEINALIKYCKNMEIPMKKKKEKRKRNEFVELCTRTISLTQNTSDLSEN